PFGAGGNLPSGGVANNVVAYFQGQVLASDAIVSMANPTFSDARAKKVLGRSSGEQDLRTLDQLQVTDFAWIDQVNGPKGTQKKVIAQQVEKVLPNAVSRVSRPIPNIYENAAAVQFDSAHHELTLTTRKPHGLVRGDHVDVFTDSGDLTKVEVLAVPAPDSFVLADEKEARKAFVYGKWVDDFRVVDYD